MKNSISTTLAVLLFMYCAFSSCNKTNSPTLTGGKGGKATLLISPEHHGFYVDSCMIYIKYAATDKPANNIYDDSSKCILNDTIPVATFKQLKTGQYYIYGYGYHATYNQIVFGGLPVSINIEDSQTVYLPTFNQ